VLTRLVLYTQGVVQTGIQFLTELGSEEKAEGLG
jgi:hypothetical protein